MSKALVDREEIEAVRNTLANGGGAVGVLRWAESVLAAQPAEAEGVGRWSELKKLAEKATPGPWVPFCKTRVQAVFGPDGPQPDSKGTVVNWPGFDSSDATSSQRKANAKFIAAANPATVLSLIAALSAVTAERDRLREEMAELWKRIDKFQSQSHGITALAEIERLRAEAEALRVALLGIASVNPAERGIEWAKAYASDGLSGTGSELYIRWLETLKEAEALRKDAVRWRYVRLQGDDTHWLNLLRVDLDEFGGNINAAVDALIDGEAPDMAAKEA